MRMIRAALAAVPASLCPLPALAAAEGTAAAGFLIIVLLLGLYFLPAIVAFTRAHQNAVAVFFLNLLLGWTLVGWAAAFIWGLMKPPTVVVEQANSPLPSAVLAERQERHPCPYCAELIVRQARVCRYCSRELPFAWLALRRMRETPLEPVAQLGSLRGSPPNTRGVLRR